MKSQKVRVFLNLVTYIYILWNVSFLGNRTFLVVNNSGLMKLAQMYEFIAEGPQEKKQWVHLLGTSNDQILIQFNLHNIAGRKP